MVLGGYMLTIDQRLKSQVEKVFSRATLFDVTIDDLHADLAAGLVTIKGLAMTPDWGHIAGIDMVFDPKKLRKPGVVELEKVTIHDGSIRHWGKLGFLPVCPIDQPFTPGEWQLTIYRIEWGNIQRGAGWPAYLDGQKPVTFRAMPSGLCRL